jgi:hypothetical protein
MLSMTSFPAAARRVRAVDLPPRERLLALRECVVRFAPYGFRATWHHVVTVGRLPQRLEFDPGSLDRALAELEPARVLWLSHREAYAAHRRDEKARGRRTPQASLPMYSWVGWLAYCPNPEMHPTQPLEIVVERALAAHSSGVDWPATCAICGTPRSADQPRPRCGVDPRGPRSRAAAGSYFRWHQIWQRTAFLLRH